MGWPTFLGHWFLNIAKEHHHMGNREHPPNIQVYQARWWDKETATISNPNTIEVDSVPWHSSVPQEDECPGALKE